MDTSEYAQLAALKDSAYLRASDSLIEKHRNDPAGAGALRPGLLPDLPAALKVRAENPERAAKFTAALRLENTEYVNPRSITRNPTTKQLLIYLRTFGPEYASLIEEYFFQLPGFLKTTGVDAGAMRFQEIDPDRARKAAAAAFAAFSGNDAAQDILAGAVEEVRAVSAREALWQTYRTTGDALLRQTARCVLASFGDADMKAELERRLNGNEAGEAERSDCVTAYQIFRNGDNFETLVNMFRKFHHPATRRLIAEQLVPSDPESAEVQEGLIRETKDEDIKAELQANLDRYRSMADEPANEDGSDESDDSGNAGQAGEAGDSGD